MANHSEWSDLYKKLKKLLDEDVSSAEFDLQKTLEDIEKYLDSVRNGRKGDYDDILSKIR